MPTNIRIMIVDDHSIVRMGLAGLLAMVDDIEVVAEAEDFEQALTAFETHAPDVTLMDVRMPGGTGLDALARIKARAPDARVIMLSTYELDEPMVAAFKRGASGYVLKSLRFDDLIDAIRTVHSGGTYFPLQVRCRIEAAAKQKPLTSREIEILELIRLGLSNKEIGRRLTISENTAKFHVKAILGKLGVADRAEAVATAFERGLLHVG